MSDFLQTSARDFDPLFDRIGSDWMLICAGDGKCANAMTASWGGCGVLWNLPVAFCFVRPQRFTHEILEKSDRFALAFFDGLHRDALQYCGTHSGRDGDKFTAAGLTCAHTADGVPYPAEASKILVCRKLYADALKHDAFVDNSLLSHYKNGDFHTTYIGEIESVLIGKGTD